MKCKHFGVCGGCVNIDKDYNQTLQYKKDYVQGLFSEYQVQDCVGNYYPFKYRNKLQLAFHELKGKTLIGFFEENTTRVVDINECMLNGDYSKKVITILREYISRFKLRAYSPNKSGVLRYAHVRCIDDNIQLTLVVMSDNFAGRDWLYNKLAENFKSVSLYLNINNRTDRAVFDKNFKFIKGARTLNFNFMGIKVELYPSSFLQVNLNIASKVYKRAQEMLEITPTTKVLDLYSGIGITSILFAKTAREVIGVEEVLSAVNNAKNMAKLNNINNAKFICAKCEDVIDSIENSEDIVVFLDPARLGVDRVALKALLRLNPRKIVYMSCNPETCVRDIKMLTNDNKYQVNDIIPYDMFPFTKHVEMLVCLQRQE